MFFLIAATHCIISYFLAFPAQGRIVNYFNHHENWFALSAFAIALGLFGLSTGYKTGPHDGGTFVSRLEMDEARLLKLTRVAVLMTAGLMFYIYSQLPVLELLAERFSEIGSLRYLSGEEGSTIWVLARGLDILTYTLPLLWILRKGKVDYLIYSIGMIAMLLPLRRASLAAVLLLPVLTRTKKIHYWRLGSAIAALLLIYATSQLFFLADSDDNRISAMASASSEVRDLGWTMALLGPHYLYGSTFIQPLDPLPAFMDEWKRTHTMEYVTATLLGYDLEDRKFAGLRLTVAGEAFVNFWFWGPPIVGFLLGRGAAWAERSWVYATSPPAKYLGAVLITWICFWLYLGGTLAVATLKGGAVVLASLYFASQKEPATSGPAPLQLR